VGTLLKGGIVVELEPACVEQVDLRIEGERIVARGPDLQASPDDEVIALSGKLVFPGLVSSHQRLYGSLGRGMPRPKLENYQELLEKVRWRYEEALDLDAVQVAATAGGLEALQCGTTTLFDLHSSPRAVHGSLLRVGRGLHEVGVRGVLSYAMTDRKGAVGREEGLEESVSFISKARGRLRGQVGSAPLFTVGKEGLEGLAEAGLPADPDLVVSVPFGLPGGESAMRRLLALRPRPTAVFAESDELAFGALAALRRAGVAVPAEVSIVGFDDHELAALLDLTTVRQRVPDQGALAARVLLRALSRPEVASEELVLPTELVVRATTAAPVGAVVD